MILTDSTDRLVKDSLETHLRQSRALEVPRGLDVVVHRQALRVLHGLLPPLAHLLDRHGVLSQIQLGRNEDDGRAGG